MWIELKGKNYNFNEIEKWYFSKDGEVNSNKNWQLHLYTNTRHVVLNLTQEEYKDMNVFLLNILKVKLFTNFVKS